MTSEQLSNLMLIGSALLFALGFYAMKRATTNTNS